MVELGCSVNGEWWGGSQARLLPSTTWRSQPHSCRVLVGAAALIIPLLEDFVDHFLGEYAGDGAGAF